MASKSDSTSTAEAQKPRPKKSRANAVAERRRLILKAAEMLFRHYGPGKTTIADIAKSSGIGVGTVYLEFSSKDELLAQLSRRRHDVVLEAMEAAASAPGPYGPRIPKVFEAQVEALWKCADEGNHACDLLICPSSPVKKTYENYRVRQQQLLAELLRRGKEAGQLSVEEPDMTALAVQRAYASFAPPGVFEQNRERVREMLGEVGKLILSGLLVRG